MELKVSYHKNCVFVLFKNNIFFVYYNNIDYRIMLKL